mgnify:CR=1 FL=1
MFLSNVCFESFDFNLSKLGFGSGFTGGFVFVFLACAVGESGGGPRCAALSVTVSVTVPYSRLKFDLVIGKFLIILILMFKRKKGTED